MKLAKVYDAYTPTEPVWHLQIAVLVAIALQLALSSSLTVGPKYIITGFEALLLLALALLQPGKKRVSQRLRRTIAVVLVASISLTNITSLILVVHTLFYHSIGVNSRELIFSGLAIYMTNIIIFGLWYWELDSNGIQGQPTANTPMDFLFPQMTLKSSLDQGSWCPTFFDYLYISVTNATAFSPTDALPLTHRAKMLMSAQSFVSLVTVALVAARAVNILS